MHTTNYANALILASPDCKADAGTVPSKPKTVAGRQHALLAAAPYSMTSDDLLCAVEAERKGVATGDLPAFRAEFFASPRACLRTSPLVKTHGWGIHHDAQGRVALIGRETADYSAMVEDPSITKVAGVRSRRA